MYNKILVPVDGSPTSERGLDEAIDLARALGSQLVLLHVVDTVPMVFEMATAATWKDVGDGLRQAGQAVLDRARQRVIDHGVAADAHLVEERPERVADIVLDEARAKGCSLVVMGSHGRRGFSRVMMGSDAERVARQCPVPLLLVRHVDAGTAA